MVVGGLNWTVGVAAKFILNLIGGLIRLLIPASWAKDGLEVMDVGIHYPVELRFEPDQGRRNPGDDRQPHAVVTAGDDADQSAGRNAGSAAVPPSPI